MDGKADVIVGAFHEDPGSSPNNAGRAYVFGLAGQATNGGSFYPASGRVTGCFYPEPDKTAVSNGYNSNCY